MWTPEWTSLLPPVILWQFEAWILVFHRSTNKHSLICSISGSRPFSPARNFDPGPSNWTLRHGCRRRCLVFGCSRCASCILAKYILPERRLASSIYCCTTKRSMFQQTAGTHIGSVVGNTCAEYVSATWSPISTDRIFWRAYLSEDFNSAIGWPTRCVLSICDQHVEWAIIETSLIFTEKYRKKTKHLMVNVVPWYWDILTSKSSPDSLFSMKNCSK